MAIDFCNLCNEPCVTNGQIGNNNMQETWRLLVAQALCSLQSSLGTPNTPLPEVALGFAVLQADYAAYADPGFLDGQSYLKRLRVNNTTDAVILISLDGGVSTFLSVPAGEDTGLMDLGTMYIADPTDFQIRRASGDTATSGTLYLQGSY